MKNIILYSIIFSFAFAITSFVIYDFNNRYVNIFEFDFRNADEVVKTDSIAALMSTDHNSPDTLASVTNLEEEKKELRKDYEETKSKLNATEEELKEKEKQIQDLKDRLLANKEEKHEDWLKSTVKLYEEMADSGA